MLILTRRPGESITIETPEGRTIMMTVLAVKGTQVRVGFTADKDVSVVRNELLSRERKGDDQ